MTAARTGWVWVPCPSCGNINRRARRACKGDCGGSGQVLKSLPTAEAQAHDIVERELRRAQEDDDGVG
jgi:hypothetical protein